jgi:hypothetical protein
VWPIRVRAARHPPPVSGAAGVVWGVVGAASGALERQRGIAVGEAEKTTLTGEVVAKVDVNHWPATYAAAGGDAVLAAKVGVSKDSVQRTHGPGRPVRRAIIGPGAEGQLERRRRPPPRARSRRRCVGQAAHRVFPPHGAGERIVRTGVGGHMKRDLRGTSQQARATAGLNCGRRSTHETQSRRAVTSVRRGPFPARAPRQQRPDHHQSGRFAMPVELHSPLRLGPEQHGSSSEACPPKQPNGDRPPRFLSG